MVLFSFTANFALKFLIENLNSWFFLLYLRNGPKEKSQFQIFRNSGAAISLILVLITSHDLRKTLVTFYDLSVQELSSSKGTQGNVYTK